MLPTHSRRLWLAVPLVLGACSFGLDGHLVRNDDGGIGDDGGDKTDATPNDIDAGEREAETLDAEAQCDGGACDPACSQDTDCSGDTYCSAMRETCQPRCSAALGCMARSNDGNVSSLISDGQRIYWAESSGTRGQARLVAWDMDKPPVVISTGYTTPAPELVADGVLYFFDDGALRRVATAPNSASELVARNAPRVWVGAAYVYWSVARSTVDTHELWRLARAGGTPELVHTGTHHGFAGGDDTRVYHWEGEPGVRLAVVVEEDVPAFVTQREVYTYGTFYSAAPSLRAQLASNDVLYFPVPEFPSLPVRIDLRQGEGELVRGLFLESSVSNYLLRGDYVYATGVWSDPTDLANSDKYRMQVRRVRQNDPYEGQSVLDISSAHPGYGTAIEFTVHEDQLVFSYDERMFTKSLAP